MGRDNTVFAFPGQGSQYVGMGEDFFLQFPGSKEIYEEVDDSLGFKLSDLVFRGPLEELSETQNTQPAIFATSMAVLSAIVSCTGKQVFELCSYAMGHSLGEYSALCAAGSMSISSCAKILRKRGELMKDACPPGQGGMAAIIGMNPDGVDDLIRFSRVEGESLVIANDNSNSQIVISGHVQSVKNATEKAKDFGAMKAVLLEVSGAFHSPLMESAQFRFEQEISQIKISKPNIPVVMNVSAVPTSDSEEIASLLVRQITGTVRFRESINFAHQKQISKLVEIGPKNVLCGLVKRIERSMDCVSVETTEGLSSLVV